SANHRTMCSGSVTTRQTTSTGASIRTSRSIRSAATHQLLGVWDTQPMVAYRADEMQPLVAFQRRLAWRGPRIAVGDARPRRRDRVLAPGAARAQRRPPGARRLQAVKRLLDVLVPLVHPCLQVALVEHHRLYHLLEALRALDAGQQLPLGLHPRGRLVGELGPDLGVWQLLEAGVFLGPAHHRRDDARVEQVVAVVVRREVEELERGVLVRRLGEHAVAPAWAGVVERLVGVHLRVEQRPDVLPLLRRELLEGRVRPLAHPDGGGRLLLRQLGRARLLVLRPQHRRAVLEDVVVELLHRLDALVGVEQRGLAVVGDRLAAELAEVRVPEGEGAVRAVAVLDHEAVARDAAVGVLLGHLGRPGSDLLPGDGRLLVLLDVAADPGLFGVGAVDEVVVRDRAPLDRDVEVLPVDLERVDDALLPEGVPLVLAAPRRVVDRRVDAGARELEAERLGRFEDVGAAARGELRQHLRLVVVVALDLVVEVEVQLRLGVREDDLLVDLVGRVVLVAPEDELHGRAAGRGRLRRWRRARRGRGGRSGGGGGRAAAGRRAGAGCPGRRRRGRGGRLG